MTGPTAALSCQLTTNSVLKSFAFWTTPKMYGRTSIRQSWQEFTDKKKKDVFTVTLMTQLAQQHLGVPKVV